MHADLQQTLHAVSVRVTEALAAATVRLRESFRLQVTPTFSRWVARLDASLEKAQLRYDFEFHLPLLEDVRRVTRGILRHTTPALPPPG